MEVGVFKSGEKRFEIRHINDIKVAHEKSWASPVHRSPLGRKPTSVPVDGSRSTEATPSNQPEPAKNPSVDFPSHPPTQPANVNNAERGKIQNELNVQPARYPRRETRNPSPAYIDELLVVPASGPPPFTFAAPTPKPWIASQQEIAEINRSINRGL